MEQPQEIYTNSIRLYSNVYEFVLSLQLQTPSEDGTVTNAELARVRMSPQQAMALALLMTKQLKAYGDQFKEIFLPEDLIQTLTGQTAAEPGRPAST